MSIPGGSVVKNQPANAGEYGSVPKLGKIPWRRKWPPTPVFLPGRSHEQRNLADCSPWGRKSLTQLSHWTITSFLLGPTSLVCVCARSCLTLCDPMNCSQPGSSVHGILQARILEWVAIPFSRGFSQPRDQTCFSCIVGGFFTAEPPASSLGSANNFHLPGVFKHTFRCIKQLS